MKPELKLEDIARVYNGRPGCACGCRGKYTESVRSKKILLKKFAEAKDFDMTHAFNNEIVYFWDSSENRTHSIYVKTKDSK